MLRLECDCQMNGKLGATVSSQAELVGVLLPQPKLYMF
jgi:hypothetical protein